MCEIIKSRRNNCWTGYFEAGFYEIDFTLKLDSFDQSVLFEYAEGMDCKTGPWDYALEDKGEIKTYQLLLPEVVLNVDELNAGRTVTFIPTEEELRLKLFRGTIGWQNNVDGNICFCLECSGYEDACFSNVKIRGISDFMDKRTINDLNLSERFWVNQEKFRRIKENWYNSFWGINLDRGLDCLAELEPPKDMNEASGIFSILPEGIRKDLTFFGCYIACLSLRCLVFERYEDKTHLVKWVDSITALPHWGIGVADGADYDNDLTAAFNMFGLALATNWLPEALGDARLKIVKEKIYIQTKRMVEHAKACRSSWPGSSTQNHAFFGYQTILLGGLTLLNDYPEAIEWVNISTAAFKRFLNHLPEDGSYHEGVGYVPFALYGLIVPLLLLESVTREEWVPHEWLQNHWKFCAELIPNDFTTGFYIDDGSDSMPTCVPLAFKVLFDSDTSVENRKNVTSIINKIFKYHRERFVASTSLLENFWGMLWNCQPDCCLDLNQQSTNWSYYNYFDRSGFVIVNINQDLKLYFLSGPPQGYTDYRNINRYGCGHHHPHTGNILLNYKGKWLLSDTGYSICKKSSEHNILIFNETGQYNDGYVWSSALPEGIDFSKVEIVPMNGGVKLSLELAMYYPPNAGVLSWNRCIKCYYNKGFEVIDTIKCRKPSGIMLSWGSDLKWQGGADVFEFFVDGLQLNLISKHIVVSKEVVRKRSKEDWYALRISPEEQSRQFTFISRFSLGYPAK
jgi:hypothetical protein